MKSPCHAFRAALELALAGEEPSIGSLGWHEHLLACPSCRVLLDSERALEALLASLPAPRLDAGLAARVMARLASERGAVAAAAAQQEALDRLLARSEVARAPRGLGQRVLAGLQAERADAALDDLLARWAPAQAPAGLAARVLAGLERSRRPVLPWRVPQGVLRLAAGLLLALGLGLGLRALFGEGSPPESAGEVAPPSPELLATLELLESWELLNDTSLEVALTGLDEVDAILLEIERGHDPLADDSDESDPPPPSEG